ncbi:type II secretion system protein GspD [Methylobacterium sp. WL103]|uniref:type II secretion system secretin GspD n=1 Tax=Methylobacterium sp. WL103 TaxID=2603891 RepID=UPI0011C930A7|nr:type II secretion system secretin GspD [Methylobacterium sp. WL103]TXN07561.1 type II secretion system protein GspD [Methylobacterium sp. WL103]
MSLTRLSFALVCCAGLLGSVALARDTAPPRASLTGPETEMDLTARPLRRTVAGKPSRDAVVAPDRGEGRTYNFSPEDVEATAGLGSEAVEIGTQSGEAGSYRLNFERAEVKDVVHAILNDTLGLNYTMASDVAGQITISSPRPMTRVELLSALETVLSGQGYTMTRNAAGYRITSAATSIGNVSFGNAQVPGYGVSVVPLRYVSAAVMSKLVSGFVTEADGLRFDTGRNTIIVKGPGPRRQEAVSAILAFDADWMRGQSVSLFELRRARPEAVVADLTQLFDTGENGASSGLIQFKPITRLRAVMAMSKNPSLIRRAETFVRKLDGTVEAAEETVFIYKARYRDAKELARVINGLFGTGNSNMNTNSPTQGAGLGGLNGGGQGQGRNFAGGNQGGGLNGVNSGSGYGSLGQGNSGNQGGAQQNTGADLLRARFASAYGDSMSSNSMADGGPTALGGGSDSLDLTRRGNGARRVSISADPSNNSVITYADGETYRKINAALRQLDATPAQVAVNVTIAEVTLTDQLKYGVQYFLDSKNIGLGKGKGSIGLLSAAAATAGGATNALTAGAGGGFNFLVGGYSGPDVVLSALDGFTDVKILSSPSLVVIENQPASLQVGDSVPITTTQAQGITVPGAPLVSQVEFRDTGIILNVVPRIGQNDAVTMQIEQEISAVVGASNTLTPTISKRRVASTISVANGQTVLLAGLISEKRQTSRDGIPFIDRIPNVGDLFSSVDNGAQRTELVVFIRPVVVRSGRDAQRVAEDYRGKLLDAGARRGAALPARRPVYKP